MLDSPTFARLLKLYYPQDGWHIDWPDDSLWEEYVEDLYGNDEEDPVCLLLVLATWGTPSHPTQLWYVARSACDARRHMEEAAMRGEPVPRRYVSPKLYLTKPPRL